MFTSRPSLRNWKRSLFLGSTAATLLCTSLPASAQTLEVVRVASPPVDVAGNVFYAIDLGYFKSAGLDVQITPLASGASVVAAVAGGAIDIGSANFVAISAAHLSGIPLVFVAPSGANTAASPIDGIVVATNSPIKTAKDLNGKTMMTSALQNILQVQANAWIDRKGGDYKGIKWVESPPAQEGGAVAAGRVDAATITEPYLSAAIATGDVRLLTYTGSEVAPVVVEGGMFCTADYAKSHADVIRKFSRAVLEAGRWANRHHDEAMAILSKYSKSPPKPGNHAVYPETFKAADLQSLIDASAKYGALKSSYPAAEIVIPELR